MERDETVDIAKGIGIILVIIGHLNHFFSYESLILTIIYSFHMPLFIILSGYVLNYQPEVPIKEYCYKRFIQIIKPYFIFAVITYIYDYFRSGTKNADGIYGIFIGNGVDDHLDFNIALWFLPMLFLCNIIFWCTIKLSRYIKNKVQVSWFIVIILSIFFSGGGYFLIIYQKRLPWGIETALFSQVFMILGYIFKVLNNQYSIANRCHRLFSYLCPIIVVVWWIGTMSNGRVDMNAGRYGNIFIFFLAAISGFYMIWQISYFAKKLEFVSKLLVALGKDSIYIMAYHIPATYIVYNVILPYMPNLIKSNAWKPNVVGLLYICIGDILVALFMKLLHTCGAKNNLV